MNFLGQAGTQQNAYDRAGDYSLSSNDVSYRFVSAFVYDLPWTPATSARSTARVRRVRCQIGAKFMF